jgi:biotin operon repressor
MGKIPGAAVTPLWIVAAFVTLTEAVLGYAVTQVEDCSGIQIALTSFVIAFGMLVATAFFLILWDRPYVFYPPSEYRDSDPRRFVDAMKSGMNKFELNLDHLNEQLDIAKTQIVDEAARDVEVVSDGARQRLESAVSSQMELLQREVLRLQAVADEMRSDVTGVEALQERILRLLQSDTYDPKTSYGIAQKLQVGVPEIKYALDTLVREGIVVKSRAGKFFVYAPSSAPERSE